MTVVATTREGLRWTSFPATTRDLRGGSVGVTVRHAQLCCSRRRRRMQRPRRRSRRASPSLHRPDTAAARRATGLPAERLAVVSRLFTAPDLRRVGVGRALLRYATSQAESRALRAVLDVGNRWQHQSHCTSRRVGSGSTRSHFASATTPCSTCGSTSAAKRIAGLCRSRR